ncbi:MAG: hypothetical protein ACTHJK_05200, partial [Sphingomicrobium sp.]
TSTLTDNLKVLNETTLAYGNFGHALENLTFNQKMGGMLTNMLGDKVGDPGEVFNQLIRAFEIRGSAMDHHRYQGEASKLFQAMVATHGTVNPEQFLGFVQQANPAVRNFSERYLTRIAPSLIQEFGGERAGTMQTAFLNQILGRVGVGGKKITDEWVRLGLVPKVGTGGNLSKSGWTAGSLRGTDLAMRDPLQWTEQVLIPALKAHGVNTDDRNAMLLQSKKLFGRETAARLASTLLDPVQRGRLHKDEALFSKALGPDQAYAMALRNDPKMALAATAASLKNLETVIGKAITPQTITALTKLAGAINWLAGAFDRHPMWAKGMAALMGLGAIAATFKVFGVALGFVMSPLKVFGKAMFWVGGLAVRAAPLLLNGLLRLAPVVMEGMAGAFALLSNPIGWAIILGGVVLALAYYFRGPLMKAWTRGWAALKNWALSFDWKGLGWKIADSLTFGLATKLRDVMSNPVGARLNINKEQTRLLAGARASGGPVRRGGLYLVGERGPELFRANDNGRIVPNHHIAAMRRHNGGPYGRSGGVHIQNLNINGARDPQETAREVRRELNRLASAQSGLLSD